MIGEVEECMSKTSWIRARVVFTRQETIKCPICHHATKKTIMEKQVTYACRVCGCGSVPEKHPKMKGEIRKLARYEMTDGEKKLYYPLPFIDVNDSFRVVS